MKFSFEADFSIKSCEQGGYVINQTGKVEGVHRFFEKAFSDLEDLVTFLTEQKDAHLGV